MAVAVLGIKGPDSIWGPIRPTKRSNGTSVLTNRRGVLVNASNLLHIIAELSLLRIYRGYTACRPSVHNKF